MKIFYNLSSNRSRTIVVVLSLLITLPIIGQNNSGDCINNVSDTSIYEETLIGELFTFSEVYPGKNYFNDNWLAGNIFLENGKTIYNKILNYHLITQQLIWSRSSDKAPITIEKSIVKEFTIKSDSGSNALFRKIKLQPWGVPDSVEVFLQVLAQGYCNLFAFRKVVIGNNSETAYPVSEYYFNVAKGNKQRIKLSRSSLYSAVKENKALMKKIVKANHLKIRRETGIIQAINLFNKEMSESIIKSR